MQSERVSADHCTFDTCTRAALHMQRDLHTHAVHILKRYRGSVAGARYRVSPGVSRAPGAGPDVDAADDS